MCFDALTPEEVDAELGPWRPLMQPHILTFRKIISKLDPPELMFCTFCKKSAVDTGCVIQHCMSIGHIGMVYLAGRVFSRSKDMNVMLGMLQELAEMVGVRCPTRLTATAVDHRIMKTVFWSSEIELTNSLKGASPFPFLNGYQAEECAAADVMSRKELEEEAENIAAMRAELKTAASVDNGDEPVEFHRVCIYCNKFKAFTWDLGCLLHNLMPAHMEKVLSSGAVFSRSKDYEAAYDFIQELYQLPLSDTAPPAVDKVSQLTVCRSPSPSVPLVERSDSPCSEPMLEEHFPLLRGHNKHECHDALTPEEVEAELAVWRPVLKKHMSSVHLVLQKRDPPKSNFCTYCEKTASTGNLVQHLLSVGHIGMVYISGMVLSRSKDMDVLLEIFREVASVAGFPAPTRSTASEADSADQMKTVFWSSDAELAVFLETLPPLPFLCGYDREECEDAMTKEDFGEEFQKISSLRSRLNEIAAHAVIKARQATVELEYQMEFSSICVHCNKFRAFPSPIGCLQHCLMRTHLEKVLSSGAVFSRSKDYDDAYYFIQELYQLPLSDTAPPAVEASDAVSSAEPVAQAESEHLEPRPVQVNPVVSSQAAQVAHIESKPLESRPVQEVNPHKRPPVPSQSGTDHTLLMGSRVSTIPMLSLARQKCLGRDFAASLTNEQVSRICLNFRTFAPPFEHLCGVTRHPVSIKFIESCAPICQFCNIEVKCLCQMVTHFFSEQHYDALLLSGVWFMREDVKVWTDVVDALVTETTLDRRHAWRRMNCWTNVDSPEKPTSSAKPETTKEAREGKKKKSDCAIS